MDNSTDASDLAVTRNDTLLRYELHHADELLSFADFSERDGAVVVPHVETKPEHRGNGYSTQLMAGVVDDIRARSLKIVPHCPVARAYVQSLPDGGESILAS